MNYELKVTETARKDGKFSYQVIDENGTVLSTRSSNREYVACTIDGKFYFGRLDLIGQGDHGKHVKYCNGYRWQTLRNGKDVMVLDPAAAKTAPTPIAYKK